MTAAAAQPESLARVALLGQVRAWSAAPSPLDLGTTRQRTLFALLCLRANTAVSVESLLEDLWDGAPPATGARLLHTYVCRLRRSIHPDGRRWDRRGVLTSEQRTYRLALGVDVLDVASFEREVAAGSDALARGDLVRARLSLGDALARWGGEPCTGLSTRTIDAERRRLTERWLTAKQDWSDLELRAGNTGTVVADLRTLVDEYPTRERLVELLMRALYGEGRQGEAVDLFLRTRCLLDDELGVAPGGPLNDLYVRILRADPTLRRTEGSHEPALPSVPAQLPPGPAWFTGRIPELRQLDRIASHASTGPSAAVVAILGPAGVGKSAVAVHWARRAAKHFPDGQLYVNLRGSHTQGAVVCTAVALRGFVEALGATAPSLPGDPPGLVASFRNMMADKRVLVVIDDAGEADQVRPLLPVSPGSMAIVTSRQQLTGLVAADGARPIGLGSLSDEEGYAMLSARLGADRVTGEDQAARVIVEHCNGLPLALAILAARVMVRPGPSLTELARELQSTPNLLDCFDTDDPSTHLRAALSASYHALSADAATLLRWVAAAPDGTGVTAAAERHGWSANHTRRLLRDLVQAHLLVEQRHGHFAVPDLVRAYAHERYRSSIAVRRLERSQHSEVDITTDHPSQRGHRWRIPGRARRGTRPPRGWPSGIH